MEEKTVSIIIPVCNESGNIEVLFNRIPKVGVDTEIIWVEGHSTDESEIVIMEGIEKHPEWECHFYKQPGRGKGDAVFYGLEKANGDICIILDADLSVNPEIITDFYDAIISGKGDMIIGVRLAYPIEQRLSSAIKLAGNKMFSWTFSWLLGQKIRDTLCGTKAFTHDNYLQIRDFLNQKLIKDPYGDFYFIFAAAKLNLRIFEIPLTYHKRSYGKSKTRILSDGIKLVGILFSEIKDRIIKN
mgnify:CR=1 FL=1